MTTTSRSDMTPPKTSKAGLVAFVIAGICLLVAFWAAHSLRGDDPHITFVYSRNIADGLGFVFNRGDRTLSTTTPLMALLMAAPSLMGLNVALTAIALSVLSMAGICFLLGTNLRAVVGIGGVIVMLPVAVLQPFFLTTITNEVLPSIVLALFALHQLTRRRLLWAASAASLSALMRPDGGLVLVIVCLGVIWSAWIESRSLGGAREIAVGIAQRVWRPGAVILAISLPWLLFATWYFGSPIPVTLEAKRGQRDLGLGQSFAELLRIKFRVFVEQGRYLPVTVLAICGMVFVAALVIRRRSNGRTADAANSPPSLEAKTLALFLSWNVIYALSYLSLGVNAYGWYVAPLGVSVAILVGLGAGWIIQQAGLRSGSPNVAIVTTAVIFAFVFLPMLSTARDIRDAPLGRAPIYLDVGRWIAANVPTDASVATLEVGLIGYEAHREIIDFAGLLQPDVIIDAPAGGGYDGAALLAWNRYDPEFVAMLQPGIPTLLNDERFQNSCRVVATFSEPDTVEVMDMWDCQSLS